MKKCKYCGMEYNPYDSEWQRWNGSPANDNGYCDGDCERREEQEMNPERYSNEDDD